VLAVLLARPRVVVEADERPVVVAVAFGAGAARHLLPCPGRDAAEQGVGAQVGATDPDRVVAGHRQHVADLADFQLGPQGGVGAVDLVAGHPRCRDAGVQRAADHLGGQGRLGRKPHLGGDTGRPQAVRVIGPGSGQVRSRSIRACPAWLAYTRYTATWAFSTRPAVYWRCTPTVAVPFLRSPVSSMTSTASASPRCSTR
jgi:hypothetical protein